MRIGERSSQRILPGDLALRRVPGGGRRRSPDLAGLREPRKAPEGAAPALPVNGSPSEGLLRKGFQAVCLVVRSPRLASVSKCLITCRPVAGCVLFQLEDMREQAPARASGEGPLSWVAPVDLFAYSTENNYDKNACNRIGRG